MSKALRREKKAARLEEKKEAGDHIAEYRHNLRDLDPALMAETYGPQWHELFWPTEP